MSFFFFTSSRKYSWFKTWIIHVWDNFFKVAENIFTQYIKNEKLIKLYNKHWNVGKGKRSNKNLQGQLNNSTSSMQLFLPIHIFYILKDQCVGISGIYIPLLVSPSPMVALQARRSLLFCVWFVSSGLLYKHVNTTWWTPPFLSPSVDINGSF